MKEALSLSPKSGKKGAPPPKIDYTYPRGGVSPGTLSKKVKFHGKCMVLRPVLPVSRKNGFLYFLKIKMVPGMPSHKLPPDSEHEKNMNIV